MEGVESTVVNFPSSHKNIDKYSCWGREIQISRKFFNKKFPAGRHGGLTKSSGTSTSTSYEWMPGGSLLYHRLEIGNGSDFLRPLHLKMARKGPFGLWRSPPGSVLNPSLLLNQLSLIGEGWDRHHSPPSGRRSTTSEGGERTASAGFYKLFSFGLEPK